MFFVLSRAWDKEKIQVPMRNWTSDLWIQCNALLLSHRDSTVSEVYYTVHMTRVLHTARISSWCPSPWILCSSVVKHQSTESEGLRFNNSWGLTIFSLSHTHDKTKNFFPYFFTKFKTYHLSYFYLQT